MPNYIYTARDASGKLVKGIIDVANKEEAVSKLHKIGYIITRIAESSQLISGIKIESFFESFKGISDDDMALFYVQLANMIEVGIPIVASLYAISSRLDNKKLKEILEGIQRSIESGDSLSGAFTKYPAVFARLFVNMIRAGEASGKLSNVLKKYAAYSENEMELRQKIKGALFYPMILLVAGISVMLFVVTFIIPQFAEIFMKAGLRLPVPTMLLYNMGIGIKHYWYIGVLVLIGIWFGIRYYGKTITGRLRIDRFKLNLFIIGNIYRKSAISRFGRTFATLIASGVPMLESLDIVREVMENEVLARVIGNVRTSVEKGEKISEVLRISGEFPMDVVQMVSVGEETGDLDQLLDKVSDFYDMSLGYTIKKMTTALEPLFLLIMGGMVAFIMASMLLPMFDMIKVLRH